MKFLKFVNMGGWINWVLFALLCFCLCQCVERCIYFITTAQNRSKRGFMTRLEKCAGEVKNVTFSYKKENILEDFSAKFPKGKIIGIKGKSGSGKNSVGRRKKSK